MICKFCGTDIEDDSIICRNCHQNLNEEVKKESNSDILLDFYTQKKIKSEEGKAKTSLILGIIGLFAWFIPLFGFPVTIIGIVTGSKGIKTSKKTIATIGIILCIIGLIVTIANAAYGAYLGVTNLNL